MDRIEWRSLTELAAGLSRGDFSSREATQYFLDRIQQHEKINCFVTVCGEQALKEADRRDAERRQGDSRPLLGVPFGLKDVLVTKGIRTTCSSRMLENFIPPYSATAALRLEEAGTVMVGKLAMDEFAMGSSNENSYFGNVLNPWDETRVPGGSSGGSAAAVAAGLVPGALGSDTGGSVRLPASFCGVVGLKPTYGRVSRYGVIAFASSLDQIGPLTRTVEDAALVSEIIFGKDPLDSTSLELAVPKFTASLNQPIKGLRCGLPKEYFGEGLHPEVRAAVMQAVKVLEAQGAEIVEVSLPHSEYALATYYIICTAEVSSNLARYDGVKYGHQAAHSDDLMDLYCKSRAEGFGPEAKRRIMMGTYVLSSGYYDAYYGRAQKVRSLLKRDFDNAFAEKCDVIIGPTAPSTAFKFGEKTDDPLQMYLSDIFTVTVNLAGLPGISIPCGFDGAGLPIGLQIIGKPCDEETLLRCAYHYEQNTEWHTRHPGE